jgi:hypothetical protein
LDRLLVLRSLRATDLAYEIELPSKTLSTISREQLSIPIVLRNTGTTSWRSSGTHPVHASYHLFSPQGAVIQFDNARTSFATRVEPDESRIIHLRFSAPDEPDPYLLEIDLVKQGVTWFKDRGSAAARLSLDVSSIFEYWSPPKIRLKEHGSLFGWRIPARPEI